MITYGRTEDVTHEWTRMDVRPGTPVILASMQTFAGEDPANARIRSYTPVTWTRRSSGEWVEPRPPGEWVEPVGPITIPTPYPSVKIEEENSDRVGIEHTEEVVGHIVFDNGPIENFDGEVIGEAGTLPVTQPDGETWRKFPVPTRFSPDDHVAFMQVLSFNGSQPVHPRIATSDPKTGESGFHYKLEEWPTYDQRHVEEQIGYVVLEEGRHAPGRGEDPHIEVGTVGPFDYDPEADPWHEAELGNLFGSGPPVVVTQCQTFNGSDPVVTRQRMLDDGFEVRLQEAESQGAHQADEVVGYVAMGMPLY